MIAPLLLTAFGIVFWTVLPACTRSLQLRSKLESMEPFLGLCELSNVEFNQLFYEVSNARLVMTILSRLVDEALTC